MTIEWTPDQCAAFNAAQERRDFRPATCGTDSRHRPLAAAPGRGPHCPDCDWRQPAPAVAAAREAELTRLVLALADRVYGLVEIVAKRAEEPAAVAITETDCCPLG